MQLLDAEGTVLATNPVSSSRPGSTTRPRLFSSRACSRQEPPSIRNQQFIRSRIVWRSTQSLTVPITAVVRISGQYFCFVAEPGAQGGLVAKQKPIEVGELKGNDYVVRSGLKAGETLIVSGIQKIGDGAPVRAE